MAAVRPVPQLVRSAREHHRRVITGGPQPCPLVCITSAAVEVERVEWVELLYQLCRVQVVSVSSGTTEPHFKWLVVEVEEQVLLPPSQ